MNPTMEVLTIVGTFVAASIWMMRTSIQHQRTMTDRFIRHLEKLVSSNEEESKWHRAVLTKLVGAVRRNSQLLMKIQMEIKDESDRDTSNGETKMPVDRDRF